MALDEELNGRREAATNKSWNDWFAAGFENHLNAVLKRGGILCEGLGGALAQERQIMRDEFEPKIAALHTQIEELEHKLSLNTRFADLERQLDARQAGRDASKRGAKGEKGERGARGERGLPGARGPQSKPAPSIAAWKIDRERYRAVPFYSDGKPGPAIELRDLFAQFLNEVGQSGQ